MTHDVPDVFEEYESSEKPSNATGAVGSTHDLASRDARELAIDDDLPSDSEIYYEAREHLDIMTVKYDCVNDHDGRTSVDRGCVNVSVDRRDALSSDAARILGALRGSSRNGRSMVGCAGAFPVHTPSRPMPAELDAVFSCYTLGIPREHGRSTCSTRHESCDICSGVNRQ